MTFTQRHAFGMPGAQVVATVSDERLRRAGQDPNRGWPAHAVAYLTGDPGLASRGPVFVPENYRDMDRNRGCVAGDPTEPSSEALTVDGAARVDAGELRALDADFGLLRPLAVLGYQVWALPGRQARGGEKCREWQLGVRLGPNASGELSQRICDLDVTTPGIRRAGLREVMGVFRSTEQAGYPPSVATSAQLGLSVMAYQSAELLFGRCGGVGHILLRFEGSRARAHRAGREAR